MRSATRLVAGSCDSSGSSGSGTHAGVDAGLGSRWMRKPASGEKPAELAEGGGGSGRTLGSSGGGGGSGRELAPHGRTSFFQQSSRATFSSSSHASHSERDSDIAAALPSPAPARAGSRRERLGRAAAAMSKAATEGRVSSVGASGGAERGSPFRAGRRADLLRQALLDSRPLQRSPSASGAFTPLAAARSPLGGRGALGGELGSSLLADPIGIRAQRSARHHRASGEASAAALREASDKEMDHALFNCLAFVPMEVVARLQRGIDGEAGAEAPTALGAYVCPLEVAVLFSDVSGFTQLTDRLQRDRGGTEGAESLNGILNGFFERLIAIVHDHDGDVVKFAGDAVLSMWSSSRGESLEELTSRAAACALEQLRTLDHYQARAPPPARTARPRALRVGPLAPSRR